MKDQTVLNLLQSKIGSADWSRWQMQRWSYWDYIRYPTAGANTLTFFSNALGSTDANSGLAKTVEETNVPKSRTFGQVYFVIQQVRTHVHLLPLARQSAPISTDPTVLYNTMRNASAVLMNLANQGVFNMKIGQKNYFDINQPFHNCPPGFGVNIFSHAAAVDFSSWYQQSNNSRDIYMMQPPQMIEPEQTFETTIDFPNATSPSVASIVDGANIAVNIGLIFDGYIARPVQ